jgi:hypothetical protein
MGKLVLRKTILRNMIDRVWAALLFDSEGGGDELLKDYTASHPRR